MPSAITQANLKQQNFNNSSSSSNSKLHFTPLIPKSSISKKNSNGSSNGSPHLVIKTSKRWILPPRPRPGKRNAPTGSATTSLNSNSQTHTSTSPSTSLTSASNNEQHQQQKNTSTTLHTTSKKVKSISIPKKELKQSQQQKHHHLNDKTLTSKQQRGELNYLAFLNFEESDETDRSTSNGSGETLIHDSIPTTRVTRKNLPLLMVSNSNSKEVTPMTSNVKTPSLMTLAKHTKMSGKDVPRSPLDVSPSATMVSTPSSTSAADQFQRRFSAPIKSSADKINRVDENAYFQKMYDEMDIIQDVDMDFELFSNSSTTVSPGSTNKEMSATTDDTNLTLDTEDELYNTIWEFLPRYTNNNKAELVNKETEKVNANYLYVAPSLEELMDEQDNFMNLFEETSNNVSANNNISSTFNDINDFTSNNNMKNFITSNDFDDDHDFDILKSETF
ncbi:similar to Naumovozyma castellii NCAS_0A04490 hypothetical protein [Maudiozyma barnettii]|uniref:Hap4 transcription factor heteromerisation domain-containing protein n=1 Tax=Maudiozyma barnettii TaxID=61262 RepID=A0A8H2VKU7_9SACH|nr:uncharacterized protein KABA2_13S03982 [Kazachstania barnettii]CAB4257145.1 similar to Naumovozyma castellii NCAS_0A04490 hypothetical protein [Kazachstania barnettii]CAD1779515.1 similar to Naumovozyma castellii NCAS_0A04490 hypothetical protein [Kazachstania barnettii]